MVTTKQSVVTGSWSEHVDGLETAVGRFTAERLLTNPCQVAFFEIAGDERLHVNVTHRHQTVAVRGWSGPGRLAGGFVHNRTFGNTRPSQVIREIRDMVLAERI